MKMIISFAASLIFPVAAYGASWDGAHERFEQKMEAANRDFLYKKLRSEPRQMANWVALAHLAQEKCDGLVVDPDALTRMGFSEEEQKQVYEYVPNARPYGPQGGKQNIDLWCEAVFSEYGELSETLPLLKRQ